MKTLADAIETFNRSAQPKIKTLTTRDGRMVAKLPRVGREIIIVGSPFNKDIRVRASDVAWLCEEARRAADPGFSLLRAALGELEKLEGTER